MWNNRCSKFSEFYNNFFREVNGEHFAKGRKNYKILGNLMVEEQENLDDYGCPIIRNPVDPKVDEEIWICSRYPFRLKTTLHSVGAEGEYAL